MATISSLEYQDIRNSIVSFLKEDKYFKDFNFEASNISRIINMLAYSSMYTGYYTKMLMDESIADSAKTKNALIGHANTRNYLTKFITASKAILNVKVDSTDIDHEHVPYIQILKGQQFRAVDANNSAIFFINPYDVTLRYDTNTNYYIGDDFFVIQGQQKTTSYVVSSLYGKYQINDSDCDESTIVVNIKNNKDATLKTEYVRKYDFYETNITDENCYYITASTNGTYQIHFGHDKFGREPKVGEYIEINYLKTDGKRANDANKFKLMVSHNAKNTSTNINYYNNAQISTIAVEPSTGGLDEETTDELRYNVLNYSKVRSRAVTSDDVKSVIMSNFRDVESINVWSGGTSTHRQYGKTYVSIKPKTSELLSNTSKKVILDLLINRYGVMNKTDIIFVNPNFTDILLTASFKINKSVTNENSSTISSNITTQINNFNTNILSKFDVGYYESDLITYIKENVKGLTSIYMEKKIQKRLELNYNYGKYSVYFANQIKAITSNTFDYGKEKVKLRYDLSSGDVYIQYATKDIDVVKIGNISPTTGNGDITLPKYVSTAVLDIIATPVYPDVATLDDNIVRIKTIDTVEI